MLDGKLVHAHQVAELAREVELFSEPARQLLDNFVRIYAGGETHLLDDPSERAWVLEVALHLIGRG